MSFARLLKVVTYLLASLGLIALTFGGELPLPTLALLGIGFIASWFVEAPLVHKSWWSRAITGVLCVALAAQIARGFTSGGWLGLAMEFAGLLSLSRLANRRTAVDYQQIAMLAFIQLIAATVLTTDLGYAGVFVAFVIATPWVLTLSHLRREIERNYPIEPDGPGSADLARVLASRRIVDLRFLSWTALLSIPMLLMTAAVFALFPRIGLGMLNVGTSRGQHVSGFGNDVELGGFGVIRDDPTVVVRVVPPRKLSPAEARRILRLRGTAFDHYDGKRWTRSSDESVRMSPIGEYYPLRRVARDDDLTLRLILDRLDEPVLFVPTGTVGLRLPERGLRGSPRERVTVTRGHGLDIRYTSQEELGVIYEAVVSVSRSESDVPVDRELDDERYIALPPGHERIIALARELTAGLVDPKDKITKLVHHLRDEKRYAYSLELPDTRGKAPLEAFLFDVRAGHCEYFSSALAVMLRAVGIPSRNVTGYVGGEYNSYGGYYGVRQADAHSWVEALLPERGWVVLDPTPPSRDAFQPSGLFGEVRAMLDAMRAYWMTRVVSYDLRKQLRALREMRDFFRGFGFGSEGQTGSPEEKREQVSFPRGQVALAVAALVLVAVAVALLRRRRKKRNERELDAAAREARALYLELERALAKAGHARPAHVTPEAHARALSDSGFGAAPFVHELTDVYVRSRYGARELDPETLRKLRTRLSEVA
jgi:protein-glutamine gamma-glutamyltransferase